MKYIAGTFRGSFPSHMHPASYIYLPTTPNLLPTSTPSSSSSSTHKLRSPIHQLRPHTLKAITYISRIAGSWASLLKSGIPPPFCICSAICLMFGFCIILSRPPFCIICCALYVSLWPCILYCSERGTDTGKLRVRVKRTRKEKNVHLHHLRILHQTRQIRHSTSTTTTHSTHHTSKTSEIGHTTSSTTTTTGPGSGFTIGNCV